MTHHKKSQLFVQSQLLDTQRERKGQEKGGHLLNTREKQHFSHFPHLMFQGDAFRRPEGDINLLKQRGQNRSFWKFSPKHPHRADI